MTVIRKFLYDSLTKCTSYEKIWLMCWISTVCFCEEGDLPDEAIPHKEISAALLKLQGE